MAGDRLLFARWATTSNISNRLVTEFLRNFPFRSFSLVNRVLMTCQSTCLNSGGVTTHKTVMFFFRYLRGDRHS